MINSKLQDLINEFTKVHDKIKKEEDYLDNIVNTQKLIATSILNEIILSRKIFKRNAEIGEFLFLYFNIECSKYVLNSRPLICGKVTKKILDIHDKDEVIDILNILYDVLNKLNRESNLLDRDIYDVIGGIKL